ncbi:MAG: DUF2274 domain-containing protein [Mesorhizobium sp.]|uniref:DUF2274 domain-containing protein n=1 Tax=Mesorhizobium sp. TaxID=1871066 RepID=UPI000FE5D0BD|nr:DUF2274 domain-containing protein [Mesorhizobium sp.]RWD52300.1 MAG: DUF2274 domain-containing protein [Mesorhizobium sp.]RWE61928.1 MAG: DUF2274 domain-containing protein [Mesorhizobium sp.]RWF12094.1 MAG: DUF2274 domain-containing protein [Mesorhizobium sp.]RWF22387.1 MAG: DUF2274 domain-containing protein [Mesorhizobium sp.]TIY02942.1 MAG: DUF2274 domain-containing protein [Mesorhizobium sp.]
MANLKLGKLPDRSPAKITITVSAELNRELHDYASLYRQTYGESESVAELVPFMLEAFLGSDRAFAKAKRDGLATADTSKTSRRQPFSGSE